MVDVVGFGALNYDRLFKVEKLAEGGTEVNIIDQRGAPGGSAANTIYGLAKLDMKCGFIGATGEDYEGKVLIEDFESVGVDTSRIARIKDVRTGIVVGFVDKEGERSLYVSPGANSEIDTKHLDLEYLVRSKIVHMSSFVDDKQFEMQQELCRSIAGKARISLCPGALYVDRGLDELGPMLEKCDFLFLNSKEIVGLTGKEYEEGAGELLDAGCKTVAVTLGEGGSYIVNEKGGILVPSKAQKAVDTTGAGDSFAAGFLYGVLLGRSPEDCGRIGNLVALKCIMEIGARTSLPTADELQSSKDFPK